MSQTSVEITIAERKLRIACPSGHESALLAAAAEVNLRLGDVYKNKAVSSTEQALMMTSLNLAYELAVTKQKLAQERKENKSKIKLLQSSFENALHTNDKRRA